MSEIDPIAFAGYTEARRDVMKLADHLNTVRAEYLATMSSINEAVSKLVRCADSFLVPSTDERDGDGNLLPQYTTKNPGPEDVADYVNPSQRTCSICHKPGHRKTTCPDADKDLKEKKTAAAIEAAKPIPEPLAPGKRACSNCRQPGHRAKNCLNPPAKKGK